MGRGAERGGACVCVFGRVLVCECVWCLLSRMGSTGVKM